MARNSIYRRLFTRATAAAVVGLLTASSQAGLFCDWCVDHKRPYCSPACHPTWGYHETCWRQFPPVEPCTDWGAHCSSCPTGDLYNTPNSYPAGVGPGPMPPTMQPGAIIMQQPQMMQKQQGFGAPQGNWNQRNANPAPVPPPNNQPPGQMNQPSQQQNSPRTFTPVPMNGQPGNGQQWSGQPGDNQPQDNSQLQLPNLDGVGNQPGNEDVGLPPIPDLSRANQYGRPGGVVQGYGPYQPVAQGNLVNGYRTQAMSPNGAPAAAYHANTMAPRAVNSPPSYDQSAQPQPVYFQSGNQPQQMTVPRYSQGTPQVQAPQPAGYLSGPSAIQVVPRQQPSVMGVSYNRSIRPAAGQAVSPRPVQPNKTSFLSRLNPFSK